MGGGARGAWLGGDLPDDDEQDDEEEDDFRVMVYWCGSWPSLRIMSGRIRRRALMNQLHTCSTDRFASRDRCSFSCEPGNRRVC